MLSVMRQGRNEFNKPNQTQTYLTKWVPESTWLLLLASQCFQATNLVRGSSLRSQLCQTGSPKCQSLVKLSTGHKYQLWAPNQILARCSLTDVNESHLLRSGFSSCHRMILELQPCARCCRQGEIRPHSDLVLILHWGRQTRGQIVIRHLRKWHVPWDSSGQWILEGSGRRKLRKTFVRVPSTWIWKNLKKMMYFGIQVHTSQVPHTFTPSRYCGDLFCQISETDCFFGTILFGFSIGMLQRQKWCVPQKRQEYYLPKVKQVHRIR